MCLNYFQAENQPCNDKVQENDLPDEEILSMALEIEENLEVMRENINPVVPVTSANGGNFDLSVPGLVHLPFAPNLTFNNCNVTINMGK